MVISVLFIVYTTILAHLSDIFAMADAAVSKFSTQVGHIKY